MLQATAYRNCLTGVLEGFVLFWTVRKASSHASRARSSNNS
jgi:hypothetical protein